VSVRLGDDGVATLLAGYVGIVHEQVQSGKVLEQLIVEHSLQTTGVALEVSDRTMRPEHLLLQRIVVSRVINCR
jgi:hypothetical protein